MPPFELCNSNFSLLMYFLYLVHIGCGLLFELFSVFCKNKKKIYIKYIFSKRQTQSSSLLNIFLTDLFRQLSCVWPFAAPRTASSVLHYLLEVSQTCLLIRWCLLIRALCYRYHFLCHQECWWCHIYSKSDASLLMIFFQATVE